MKIQIEHWKGCTKADITTNGVTLIAGRNGAGKSSIVEAIAYAATGKTLSPAERTRKISRGQARSLAKLIETDVITRSRSVTLPTGKGELVDWPTKTSEPAAGFIDATALKPKDLNAFVQTFLDVRPTTVDTKDEDGKPVKSDLRKALEPYGYEKAEVDNVVGYITKNGDNGWNAAHESYKDQGAKMKGKYEEITGQRFGVAQSSSWVPDNWNSELATVSKETLEANLADANSDLEAKIRLQAVDDSRFNELKEKYQGINGLQAQLKTAEEDYKSAKHREPAAEKEYDDARAALQEIPRLQKGVDPPTIECGKCGTKLLKTGSIYVAGEGPTDEQIAENKKLLDAASELNTEAKASSDVAKSAVLRTSLEVMNIRKEIKACEDAHEELMNGVDEPQGTVSTQEIEAQRQHVQLCKERLEAHAKYHKSRQQYDAIIKNQYLIEVLSPEGLRKQKLSAAVKTFNDEDLAQVCKMAEWTDPETGERQFLELFPDDMTFAFGPTALDECSEGEKIKARVTMQVALAYIDESDLIIIDKADDLDAVGKKELFTLLKQLDDKTVIVAMHYKDRATAPDLSVPEWGQTFWMQGRILQELKAVTK